VLLVLLCWRRAKLRKKRRRSKYDVAPRAADAEDGDLPGGVRLSTRVTASPSGSTGGRRRPSSSAVREDVWAGVSSNALVEVDKLLQTSTSSTSPRRNGQEGLPDDTAADFSAYQPGGRSRASPVSSPRTSRPAKLPPLAGLRSQGGKGRSSLPVQGPNGSVALMTSRTISHASQEVTENFENNFSRMSHRVEQDRQRQLEKIENLRAVRTHIAEVNKAPLQRPMLGKSTPQRMLSPPVTRCGLNACCPCLRVLVRLRMWVWVWSVSACPVVFDGFFSLLSAINSYDWEEEGFARPPSPP
jgi:hypothetical protein